MSVISLNGVDKQFRGNYLFQDVSFQIEKNSSYALVGPNGSGKSVLFKLILGFLRPDSGSIVIDPSFLSKGKSFPEKFGIIIDRPGFLAGETGLENIKQLVAIRNKVGESEIRATLQRVGLDPDLKQRAGNYSLGMKQKLAIAQAIVEDQQVLLLDEPFNGLDKDSVENVHQILAEEKAKGKTILFTSHNQEDIDRLAEVVFEINAQKVTQIR